MTYTVESEMDSLDTPPRHVAFSVVHQAMSVVQRNAIGLLLCWWCLLSPLVLAEPVKKKPLLRDSPALFKAQDEQRSSTLCFKPSPG